MALTVSNLGDAAIDETAFDCSGDFSLLCSTQAAYLGSGCAETSLFFRRNAETTDFVRVDVTFDADGQVVAAEALSGNDGDGRDGVPVVGGHIAAVREGTTRCVRGTLSLETEGWTAEGEFITYECIEPPR